VPQSSDIKELPSVSFAFFDPDAKAYRTLTQPAIKLVVGPGAAADMLFAYDTSTYPSRLRLP